MVAAVRASDSGALESRDELVNTAELGCLGPCVYRNAASALRVVDDFILDATRIHPEQYGVVLEIIANALDYDYEQLKAATPSVQRKTLEKGMDPDNWDKLAVLDLRAYAEYLAGAYTRPTFSST
jgi:transcription elongation factor SPT6